MRCKGFAEAPWRSTGLFTRLLTPQTMLPLNPSTRCCSTSAPSVLRASRVTRESWGQRALQARRGKAENLEPRADPAARDGRAIAAPKARTVHRVQKAARAGRVIPAVRARTARRADQAALDRRAIRVVRAKTDHRGDPEKTGLPERRGRRARRARKARKDRFGHETQIHSFYPW